MTSVFSCFWWFLINFISFCCFWWFFIKKSIFAITFRKFWPFLVEISYWKRQKIDFPRGGPGFFDFLTIFSLFDPFFHDFLMIFHQKWPKLKVLGSKPFKPLVLMKSVTILLSFEQKSEKMASKCAHFFTPKTPAFLVDFDGSFFRHEKVRYDSTIIYIYIGDDISFCSVLTPFWQVLWGLKGPKGSRFRRIC